MQKVFILINLNRAWISQFIFLLKNRQEKATLLGFENYAMLSLDSKMAGSPSEVWKMITDLHSKSKLAAEKELINLQVMYWNSFLVLKKAEHDHLLRGWHREYIFLKKSSMGT